MAFVVIIVAAILIGLTVKFWFVTVPLLGLGILVGAAYYVRDRRRLAAMDPDARETVLEERRVRRVERRERHRAGAAAAREARESRQVGRGSAVDVPISRVGKTGGQGVGLACPRCGGAQFKQRRSRGGRAGIVAGTVLLPGIGTVAGAALTKQKQVQCVTCGARYRRA